MSPKANIVDPVKGNSTLVWPRFSPGLLLRDDDLSVGVDYTRDLSRLLFRSLFGCGVVCGLTVDRKISCGKLIVTVASGVALNCEGDPIYVPQSQTIPIDPTCGVAVPGKLWVTLCLTQKCCAPRSAVCSCEDDEVTSVCTREQAGYEIRIVGTDPTNCACGCAEIALPETLSQSSFALTAGPDATDPESIDAEIPDETTPDTSNGSSSRSGTACWSADPCSPCYVDHYAGKCDCCGCDNSAIVLAVLTRTDASDSNCNGNDIGQWSVNHSVRRFVRPMLMRDPQVWLEQNPGKDPCATADRV